MTSVMVCAMPRPGLLPLFLVTVLTAGPLAGCTLPGEGDLIVRAGEVVVKESGIEFYQHVIVERGGILILRNFDLRASAALDVSGRLEANDSHFRVGEGGRSARMAIGEGGELVARGSDLIGPGEVRVEGGNLSWDGWGFAVGTVTVAHGGGAFFYNMDIATRPSEAGADNGFTVEPKGTLYMRNTSIRGATIWVEEGGRARLINVGLSPTHLTGPGVSEVGWPLMVRARSASGPAPDVDIEVQSVPAAGAIESAGKTGDDGVAFLEALEYVARDSGRVIEPRNPHRIVAPSRASVGAAVVVQNIMQAEIVVGPEDH